MGLGTALIYSCAFYPLCNLSQTTTYTLMIQCRISSTICFFVLNMIQVRISLMFTKRQLRLGCVWRICLFWVFVVPLENFSLIWRRHHYRWRAANFDLCSARVAIEQWVFFSVPHLLWHGASVYNGHLKGQLTLTPIAECVAVELFLPIFTTYVCRGWDSNTQLSACEENTLTHCATAAACMTYYWGK